jgi:hypothetical protein
MATKTDFTAEEWSLLRETPHLVVLGMAVAGASGIFGTIKEATAAGQSMVEAARSSNPLIQALAARDEMTAAQEGVRSQFQAADPATLQERIQTSALEKTQAAMTLLRSKGSAEDQAAYRTFLKSVAERVAQASKEGTFLGFGGERVSEGETRMLTNLSAAIGA